METHAHMKYVLSIGPALLGVAAGTALAYAGGGGWAWLWPAGGLAAGAAVGGLALVSARRTVGEVRYAVERERKQYLAMLPKHIAGWDGLCSEALPGWSRRIETARTQAEDAIALLAARFANIDQRLAAAIIAPPSSAGDVTGAAPRDGVAATKEGCRNNLRSIVGDLQTTLELKHSLLALVRGLADFSGELKSMAAEIAKIAAQMNLPALHDSIAAANTGNTRRGFAAVADEVRSLANLSGRAGRDISAKVEAVNSAAMTTLRAVEEHARLVTAG